MTARSGGRSPWSPSDREQAKALAARGFDPAAIAAQMGRTERGVRTVLGNAAKRANGVACKRRKCLGGCGREFLSDGPGNRICERCSGNRGADIETYAVVRP